MYEYIGIPKHNGMQIMNVFFTNNDPIIAAREHCYKHQTKMIVEYAQLLSTAHHVIDGDQARDGIYKMTHKNHPSAIWVRKAGIHYCWVWKCAMELCRLYTARTGKAHKTESVLITLGIPPKNIPVILFEEPPVAAPDEFKAMSVFWGAAYAYRKYLVAKFEEWQQRDKPIAVEFDITPDWAI